MLKVTLFCPVILMFFITPLTPAIAHNYKVAILWVAPYIIAGSCFLLFTYIKETNPFSKKRRLLTNLIALPPVLFQLLSNYIFRLFQFNEVWRLNAIMMFFLFVLFIIFIIKFDFFGVQLKFERRRIDSTLKAVTSGTSFLNHAIKNEVGKVNILAENIKYLTMGSRDDEIDSNASQILSSTTHLLSMIDRIQHQIQDVKLIKNKVSVSAILHECVLTNESLFKKFNIAVEEHYAMTPDIQCDQIHVKEVINNLIVNAVDAMKAGGLLRIETLESRSQVCILVKDSGGGISKHDLDHIFDPFYTTKLNSKNYGLGLSYCFNVIQKHGGRIEIFSEQGYGATIKISLPAA
ncbi:sensor histidine kinase [Paenibacillus planticolens]|nr:HAMP domain-containing sensor histidine kinase [Paenibacillus planticolens]